MPTPPFSLTTHDPDEEFEDRPESLLTLAEWLAAGRGGSPPFQVEPYEGVGVWFSDGTHEHYEASFGDARSLARNCEVAADRLAAGQVAVFRTAILDQGSYLLLLPEGDGVRLVQPRERPEDRPFPYRPSLQADSDEAIAALYRWAETQGPRLAAPTDNPAMDRAQGKLLRLKRAELVEALRGEVAPGFEVAELVGARSHAG